jgi:PAS domain S-box-containing protein
MIVDDELQKKSLGIMGFSLDQNGMILNIGDGILKLSDYAKKEVVGQNFRKFVYPEDEKGLWLSFQKDLEGILEPYVFRLIAKNGTAISVRTFSQPIAENGSVVRIDGIMTEI